MVNLLKHSQSESVALHQMEELHQRFPNLASPVRQTPLNTQADYLHGIDAKADTIDGKTLNFQFKSRPKREDGLADINIPIKKILLQTAKEADDLCVYTSNTGVDTYFIIDAGKADYFIITINDSDFVYNYDDMARAFLRKKHFSHNELKIYNLDSPIDASRAIIYVDKLYLFKLMLKDWLTATLGSLSLKALLNNDIPLSQLVV